MADPTYYQPISLTSCLRKVMKRMVFRRLQPISKSHPRQHANRKEHNTEMILARITDTIGLKRNRHLPINLCKNLWRLSMALSIMPNLTMFDSSEVFDSIGYNLLFQQLETLHAPLIPK